MFKKILCVVDVRARRQCAVHRAAELARSSESELKCVDIMHESPGWLGPLRSHRLELAEEHLHDLQELVAPLQDGHLRMETELLHGRPAIEITREVLRHGYDLVMKDARGTSGHKTLLLGSADMRLLRNCPCPVWLHVLDRDVRPKVIVAAIHPAVEDARHARLSQRILEWASMLGEIENATVHVIAAWDAPGEILLAGRFSNERLLEYVADVHRAADERLTAAVRAIRPRIAASRTRLRKGDAAEVILEYTREIDCDLLIMGTVARGMPGLLMGNTADTVLRQIECSVMTVPPDSFVSPVQPG